MEKLLTFDEAVQQFVLDSYWNYEGENTVMEQWKAWSQKKNIEPIVADDDTLEYCLLVNIKGNNDRLIEFCDKRSKALCNKHATNSAISEGILHLCESSGVVEEEETKTP